MSEPQPYFGPLAILELQEDFPAKDLTEDNADLLKYLLGDSAEIEAHARYLEDHQRSLYDLAYAVLKACNYSSEYSSEEFQAFTRGFATFEAIATVVKPNPTFGYDTKPITRRVRQLFFSASSNAQLELAAQYETWPETRPNTYDTVITIADRRERTLNELRARAIGAHFAFELQRPALDAA